MSENYYTYTVKIRHEHLKATDTAIQEFLAHHTAATVEDALDAIFAAGVRMALDGGVVMPVEAMQ